MIGLPKSAVLQEGSATVSGGLERGGDAPTRGTTFRRTFDPHSPGPGSALGGFMPRGDSGALVQAGAHVDGGQSSARSNASDVSGPYEGGESAMTGSPPSAVAGIAASNPGTGIGPGAAQPARSSAAALPPASTGRAATDSKAPDAAGSSSGKPSLFTRMFRRNKSGEEASTAGDSKSNPGAPEGSPQATASQ